jgi:hypothetical protein
MIKARRNVRPDRAGPHSIEFLEGRALLSGVTHAAAAAIQPAATVRPMLATTRSVTTVATPATTVTPPATTVVPRILPVAPRMLAVAPPMQRESHLLRDGNTVTGLVMTFSKPLDPATAQDLKNYHVSPLTPAAGDSTVSAVVYNPGQDAVTLILAQPVTLKRATRGVLFEVNNPDSNGESESTITDTSRQALQSTGGGQPDGRLFAQFKARGSSPNPLSIASRLARARAVQHKYANLGDSISKEFHNLANRVAGTLIPLR